VSYNLGSKPMYCISILSLTVSTDNSIHEVMAQCCGGLCAGTPLVLLLVLLVFLVRETFRKPIAYNKITREPIPDNIVDSFATVANPISPIMATGQYHNSNVYCGCLYVIDPFYLLHSIFILSIVKKREEESLIL